jgi:hypothetical protein
MTNLDAVNAPAPPAPPPCTGPTAELEVEKPLLTLKHDCFCRLTVNVSPPSCRATEYKIEIQRASGGAWVLLTQRRSIPWSARIAGKFKLRGMARVEGSEVLSPTKDVEVQFPSYDEIVADAAVKAALDKEWQRTLVLCVNKPGKDYQGNMQPSLRAERGWMIRLDTNVNRYILADPGKRFMVGPFDGAMVDLGGPTRKPDEPPNPKPNDKGAKYVVASFHTHTPTTYLPKGRRRPVGPSAADGRNNTGREVPGVVYDYVAVVAGAVPTGHPKEAPAQLYYSAGVPRRPTPP